MNMELERLLRREAWVTAEEALGDGWCVGTAVLDGWSWPCCAKGSGALPVAAYGERPDGTVVLVCSAERTIKPEIQAAAGARERGTVWECQFEHSCGALLFTQGNASPLYLIVEGMSGHVGFPKGHMELGESIPETVAREIREEVGVTEFTYVHGYRVDAEVLTRKNRQKTVTYFLASFVPPEGGLKRRAEEIANLWLLPYAEARKRVNTELDRIMLDRADALLAGAAEPPSPPQRC